MPHRELICGDRNWGAWVGNWSQRRGRYTDDDDVVAVAHHVRTLPPRTVIIEGCARGADNLAEIWAWIFGYELEHYPAEWDRKGKAAGPLRNGQMLEARPDRVTFFHKDLLYSSKGTIDMVERALVAGIEVWDGYLKRPLPRIDRS